MLLGRRVERLAIAHLLAEARCGRSGVLALVGEPGIGKTALLDHAAECAHGMGVLRARGIAAEGKLPFAGLAELLRPALAALERIPPFQAAALAGALALEPATARDRFAVGAATLSLLSAHGEEAPLALLVDDAHLLDGSSAQALLFAARRLVADPIAMVLAVREGEPSLLDGADLPVLLVSGLDRSAAADLLRDASLPDETVEHLYRATGGNPLALLELAPDAARLAPSPSGGPVPLSARITSAFLRRHDRLSEPARRMLVLAAASDSGDLSVLERAASSAGLDAGDLAAAEAAGLVTLAEGEVTFRHPLARSAVYSDASARERREAHASLARALPDRHVDRRAWHLAAASTGPSAQASAALAEAGERACARSAYVVAASAFERGAHLSPSGDDRARLLFAAAEAAWLGGEPDRTAALLDGAGVDVTDRVLSARIDQLRGHVRMRRGPVMEGYRLLVSAAEGIAEASPDLAVVMLAEAVDAGFIAGDTDAMLAAAERAIELAPAQGSGRATFFAAMAHGIALVGAGAGEEGPAEVRRAVAILEESDALRDDPRLLAWGAFGALWLREADAGRGLIERAFERAREEATVAILPRLLQCAGRDQATTDRWPAAEASFVEAARIARETGQWTEVAMSLAGLAWLEARQGREAACREHAAEAASLCAQFGAGFFVVWAIQALGDLELGLGRPAASVVHHEAQAAEMRRCGIADADLSPAPELVEAYQRLGRSDDAAAVATEFMARAEAKGQPWALARAARCRALLAGSGELETWFHEALRLHGRTRDAFETSRTRLAYGARLRRTRRRIRARTELRAALETFERLGARPWADQARAELAATGETARKRNASTLDDLTPQELQIAQLLADGSTTREAAAALFLSPKTVEYHLGHVYRKLAIRSREELVAALPAAPR
jgi:DNA-binding CsgD family transcriptional regulator